MSDRILSAWLVRQAYTLLLRLGTPAYLWRVWLRGRDEPDYRADWPRRLGLYDAAYRAQVASGASSSGPVLWLHAVSLGEARAATPLVQALRAARPDMRLLLTHTTATGREAGRALLRPGDLQTWLPYDTPGAVRRFLALHRPAVGVLMETEVWPNVQHEAARAGLPMVLANARLSEKSLRQGRRFAALLQPAAQALRLCLAQTQDDAARLRAMGAPAVQVSGNLKFDLAPDPALLERGKAWRAVDRRPVVLAASTREGEEGGLLDAWRQAMSASLVDSATVRPRLFIVPRHPQRFDEVAQAVTAAGFTLSRRSAWPASGPHAEAQAADVWLGDSMGEMPAYYAAADVALLGGSFAPLGGQNLIEAAACGCPVVMGPSTFNFAQAAELSEAAGAAWRVQDWPAGVAQAVALTEPKARGEASARALAFAAAHRGAARQMAEAIWQVARG
ncbi:3-deoxy-D-manno-octulosonic acid transferase [uncultured Aquabacterium sp.]|uniref:3-deoxy-D-manno-octulosonic acid transferase n=1 Tax=uncultured Aquabacterium sp. TaxID=158753 RepID=UPI00261E1254|nr:3-deoxy-D-manno-octulosonic acid transferase [uncultured Aquabacterium sp.]